MIVFPFFHQKPPISKYIFMIIIYLKLFSYVLNAFVIVDIGMPKYVKYAAM